MACLDSWVLPPTRKGKEGRRAIVFFCVKKMAVSIIAPVPTPVRNDESNTPRQSAILQYHGRINSIDGAGGVVVPHQRYNTQERWVLPRVNEY